MRPNSRGRGGAGGAGNGGNGVTPIPGATVDPGTCDFNTDFSRGIVQVQVRPPLGIATYSVELNLFDFMQVAASIVGQYAKATQSAMADLLARRVGDAARGPQQ